MFAEEMHNYSPVFEQQISRHFYCHMVLNYASELYIELETIGLQERILEC